MGNSWDRKSGISDSPSREYNQDYKLVRTASPTQSIVSSTEAKNYLKVDLTEDDDLIDSLIDASTSVIERELGGYAIYEQTWTQYQRGGCRTIELLRTPLLSTPTVTYHESFSDTTATTLVSGTDFKSVHDELYHTDGYFDLGRDGDGYTVEYTVGLVTASTVTSSDNPDIQMLKTAILRTVAWLYEQREEHSIDIQEENWRMKYSLKLPNGIRRLLMPFHTGKGLI